MRKNRIRLTESQLHKLIKESVKSFINEGGHLTWKDDDGRMHTNSQDNWYGIEGATFVSHGEWSDGEIYFDYEGEQYVINANDAEEWLWNDFKDYCEENNLNPDEHSDDEIWYNFARNEGYDVLLNLGPYNESYEMNESKKRKVRLTEADLKQIAKKSVKKILKEATLAKKYTDVIMSFINPYRPLLSERFFEKVKSSFTQYVMFYGVDQLSEETMEEWLKGRISTMMETEIENRQSPHRNPYLSDSPGRVLTNDYGEFMGVTD